VSPSNKGFSRLKCPGKTQAICRLASAVTVGNRLLADWARRHAREVYIVPSTIDLDRYPMPRRPRSSAPVTLGWTGSHSTLPFLEPLHNVLRRLAKRHRFRLVVISDRASYQVAGLEMPVVGKAWNAATEAADLNEVVIGLGPFSATGWTPWRCHGKVLQYMAAGIPAIVSPIGILPEYVRDGVNGFLAATEDEWLEKLSLLIEDPALRRRLGAAARATVEERFSAWVWAPRVKEILLAAAKHAPGRAWEGVPDRPEDPDKPLAPVLGGEGLG
jgi:glycosyltransferase involved in cell wall biosynthesis